jgi:acetyl-CoA carboxylase, biotin carboxylase subunit
VFVGPSAEAIEAMGNKARARELAAAAGVPTVPGSHRPLTVEEAYELADGIGYPVLIKAAAGGGGRGIRIVAGADELRPVFQQAALEASAAFGDGSLYIEKFLDPARHVEVQVLGDGRNLVHVFERECSLQRRRQKLIEESPSPALDGPTRDAITAAALRVAHAVDYESAGTVEFLVDAGRAFYFIEMNTRIQVEHPVTEMVSGIDLVQEQLRIAQGEALSFGQAEVETRGAAVEIRINAEDPAQAFMPSPGEITTFRPPAGVGIRVDTAAYAGYRVPPFYDSLIAKLVVWGEDRAHAFARAEDALGSFEVTGVATTIPFALDLLADPQVRAGDYDVALVERRLADSVRISP